jgi:hypothetical protein
MLIPSVIHQLVNYPKIHQADFSSLLHINSGAGYLPPKLAEGISNLLPREIFFSQGKVMLLLPYLAITADIYSL